MSTGLGEYEHLPKLVMGTPCPQHHPVKMVEVLNHYDMPCTGAAEKHGLLQALTATTNVQLHCPQAQPGSENPGTKLFATRKERNMTSSTTKASKTREREEHLVQRQPGKSLGAESRLQQQFIWASKSQSQIPARQRKNTRLQAAVAKHRNRTPLHSIVGNRDSKSKPDSPIPLSNEATPNDLAKPSSGSRTNSTQLHGQHQLPAQYYLPVQSLHPPDTNPEEIQEVWDKVRNKNNSTQAHPSRTMSTSVADIIAYDPRGFSCLEFKFTLARYGVMIKEAQKQKEQWWRRKTSLWAKTHKREEFNPDSSNVQAWNKGVEDLEQEWRPKSSLRCTEDTAEIENISLQFKNMKALKVPAVDILEFMKEKIFMNGPGRGSESSFQVRNSNNPQILTSMAKEYGIPPLQKQLIDVLPAKIAGVDSSTSKTLRNPSASVSGRSTRSVKLGQGSSLTTKLRVTARPKIESTSELKIPEGNLDLAYWIQTKVLSSATNDVMRHIFVTEANDTSPYLSIVVDDLPLSQNEGFTKEDRKRYVKHKLAVYCSAALYNRYLLHADATAEPQQQLEEDGSDILHFGVTVSSVWFQLYGVEVSMSGKGEWDGCKMTLIADGSLTDTNHVTNLLKKYNGIQDWGMDQYTNGLKRDISSLETE